MKNKIVIYAPQKLCLYRNTDETVYFIQLLHFLSKKYLFVGIDFSKTDEITTLASLVLLAHLHYIQLYKRNKKAIMLITIKSRIHNSFFEKSFFKQAVETGCFSGSTSTLSTSFPFKIYNANDIHKCREMIKDYLDSFRDELKTVLLQFYSEIDIEIFFSELLSTITEILQNINHHAYPVDHNPFSEDKLYNKFNLFSSKLFWCIIWYDDQEHKIVFAIYDLGIGMITSYLDYNHLRPQHELNRIVKLSRQPIFNELLDEGISRFYGSGRGNGLHSVFNTSMKLSDISLVVISEDIHCEKTIIGNITKQLRIPLPGTGIEWNFKLSQNIGI